MEVRSQGKLILSRESLPVVHILGPCLNSASHLKNKWIYYIKIYVSEHWQPRGQTTSLSSSPGLLSGYPVILLLFFCRILLFITHPMVGNSMTMFSIFSMQTIKKIPALSERWVSNLGLIRRRHQGIQEAGRIMAVHRGSEKQTVTISKLVGSGSPKTNRSQA